MMDELVEGQQAAANQSSTAETSSPPPTDAPQPPQPEPAPTWNYPTRMCRICHEDVVPAVTMYPPGLPPAFQNPHVEYMSEEEYGRLIRPCKCRGGMRYIHEHCLLRMRTESTRPGSLWKCHECGHQFNFQRLTVQRYLGSKLSSGLLAVLFMLIIMFFLGFVADPLINLYVDPYDTLVGKEDYWREIDINDSNDSISGLSLHFLKGMISMGLIGFLKTALLNPFQWWNLRTTTGWSSGRSNGTTTTGRDRAVNISWIAVVVGILSAFYFFYQWTQTIIGKTLQRIGNNIVDTQLPGDDDDIKPPPGFKFDAPKPTPDATANDEKKEKAGDNSTQVAGAFPDDALADLQEDRITAETNESRSKSEKSIEGQAGGTLNETVSPASEAKPESVLLEELPATSETAFSSALDSARDQGWSFVDIPKC